MYASEGLVFELYMGKMTHYDAIAFCKSVSAQLAYVDTVDKKSAIALLGQTVSDRFEVDNFAVWYQVKDQRSDFESHKIVQAIFNPRNDCSGSTELVFFFYFVSEIQLIYNNS